MGDCICFILQNSGCILDWLLVKLLLCWEKQDGVKEPRKSSQIVETGFELVQELQSAGAGAERMVIDIFKQQLVHEEFQRSTVHRREPCGNSSAEKCMNRV